MYGLKYQPIVLTTNACFNLKSGPSRSLSRRCDTPTWVGLQQQQRGQARASGAREDDSVGRGASVRWGSDTSRHVSYTRLLSIHNRGLAIPWTLDTIRMLTWVGAGRWGPKRRPKAARD